MGISFLYWLLMLLVLLLGWSGHSGTWTYGYWGGGLILYVLLFILGVTNYGWPIKNDTSKPPPP